MIRLKYLSRRRFGRHSSRRPSRTATISAALTGLLALAACSGGPPAPDWNVNAIGHVQRFTEAYLKGDSRIESREFELARAETARTGEPDIVARVELNRCAARVASLVFEPCAGFEALRVDASAPEKAYANYLAGQSTPEEAALLPAHHRPFAVGAASLAAIDDPFSRLVAAGVMVQRGLASAEDVEVAVNTASQQGWQRPLLAWLGVQARLALDREDAGEASRLHRRMDLVAPASPPAR